MAAQKPKDDLFDDALDDDFLSDDDDTTTSTSAPVQDDFFEDTEVPGQLAVDVYQTDDAITVVAPVPGVSKSDIELSIVENTLTIQGKRHANKEIKTSDYFVQECYWGEFSRSIILPVQIKEEEAEAELKDGMLSVKVPKAAQEKVKKITIKD
jgi:HSP20 family protein